MSRRTLLFALARVAGWLIVPLYVAGDGAFYLLRRASGLGNEANLIEDVEGVVLDIGFGAFAVVGALLIAKRPSNLIGWIMAAVALMVAIFNAGGAYATYVMITRGQPDARHTWRMDRELVLVPDARVGPYLPAHALSRRAPTVPALAPGSRACGDRDVGLRPPQGTRRHLARKRSSRL